MRSTFVRTIVPLLLLVLLNTPVEGQSASLSGIVRDEAGRALDGVLVSLRDAGRSTATRGDGRFSFEGLTPGRYTVDVSAFGYRPSSVSIVLPAGGAALPIVALAADPLSLEGVVVSGTFNPASTLESSTAITTVIPQVIEQRAPRGTADLLTAVPGLQVMSGTGETGADVTVRGLPQTANSSFRYISLQEDGLPAFEPPGLLFAFPDAMVRLDETVARVEAVRGGSAAVFGSSTPGGIVNVISRTGGPVLAGRLRSVYGDQGMGRLDGSVGGPLIGDWRFNVGGYYRYDRGLRDPGFTSNQGGQIRANLTRDRESSRLMIHAKFLNDRSLWFQGMPIRNFRDPQPIPGGPKIGEGTTYARERLTMTIPDAYNPGSMITRDMNGNLTRYASVGVNWSRQFDSGWEVRVRTKAMQAENETNLMIDVADPMPISSFGAPGLPGSVPRQVRFVHTGEVVSDPSAQGAQAA